MSIFVDGNHAFYKTQNLNQIYRFIYNAIQDKGLVVSPRGKKTKEFTQNTLVITRPYERTCSARNGFNIVFSIAELLWIVSGSGDSEMICHYLKNFSQFLDGGHKDFHGAYGSRIFRYGFDERNEYNFSPFVDQFYEVYKKLKADGDTRQAVINLWNPWKDNLQLESKDYPCNNIAYLKIREGKLNWTQILRSNDLIYGTPQNIFQFTFLQEVMASALEVDMGHYTQFADSLHVYEDAYYDKEKVKPFDFDIYNHEVKEKGVTFKTSFIPSKLGYVLIMKHLSMLSEFEVKCRALKGTVKKEDLYPMYEALEFFRDDDSLGTYSPYDENLLFNMGCILLADALFRLNCPSFVDVLKLITNEYRVMFVKQIYTKLKQDSDRINIISELNLDRYVYFIKGEIK